MVEQSTQGGIAVRLFVLFPSVKTTIQEHYFAFLPQCCRRNSALTEVRQLIMSVVVIILTFVIMCLLLMIFCC